MNLLKRIQPIVIHGTPLEKGSLFSRLQIVVLVVSLIFLSLFLGALLTRQSLFSVPMYQPGDIARADIIIPVDALIEDETATQVRREEAKAKALPVYRFNPSVQNDQAFRLKAAFTQSRNLLGMNTTDKESSQKTHGRPFRTLPAAVKAELRIIIKNLGVKPPVDDLLVFLVNEGFPSKLEDRIILLLLDVFSTTPIPDDTLLTQKKENIHKVNVITGNVETIPVNLLSTLARIRDRVGKQISQDSGLEVAGRPHILRIVEGLIVPNLTLDESMTKSRQEEDIKNVDHVLRKLKKGKVVLRQGDEVRADHLVQIEAIRKLSLTDSSMRKTIGMTFLIGILLTIFVFLARFITLNQWSYLRLVIFLILTLTVNILLLKVSWFVCESISQSFPALPFNDKSFFFYLLPFAYGSMLITILAGEKCAQIFIIFFCIMAVQTTGTGTYGLFYILITNLAGIIFTRKATQRIGIIGAGFKLGLSAAALFFILQMIGQAPLNWIGGSFGSFLAFLSGLVNAVFLVFTLPLCERLFMVTTEIRLSELGNLNLPLMRELILKAPGTYNHSIAVGTLCEGAAKAIGVNPLFLRISSLYHDIGKTVQPEYFVENQQEGNPHEGISPLESVHILQGHVTYSISLARKAHLPSSIVDIIPQHHGTKLMQFFHDKAKKEAEGSGKAVQEDQYRYSGPKPKTKAAAILMLADGIEAASRTLNDHSQIKLLDLIRKIITDAVEDGQLSECDITLSEMNLIANSFLETLSSYHHGRISYPGFDFNHGSRTVSDSEPIK
jgi:cyclic-di-AMP phosphodiesterase PgpH